MSACPSGVTGDQPSLASLLAKGLGLTFSSGRRTKMEVQWETSWRHRPRGKARPEAQQNQRTDLRTKGRKGVRGLVAGWSWVDTARRVL